MNDLQTHQATAATVLARRWWFILAGAVLIAAATYGISKVVPATYSSSAEVAVFVSGSDVNDTTLGANNLASQYAQMVNATPVLVAADSAVGDTNGIPSSAITGGAVAAQNLISIQATAGSADVAQRRASAVTTAFIDYVAAQVGNQAAAYQKASSSQLRPLNSEISQTQAALRAAGPATSGRSLALQGTLNTLIAQRAAALGSIAQTAVAGRPSVALVSAASTGGETSPKPNLYALVAFLVGLLVLARLAVYFDRVSSA